MLDDLLSLTNSHEFDEYGAINLVGARLEENMILTLDLNLGGDTDVHQSWEMHHSLTTSLAGLRKWEY